MATKFVTLLMLIPTVTSFASYKEKPLTIAVIDTGFGYHWKGHSAHLCQYGHKDFTGENVLTRDYATYTPIPIDKVSHGTNIVGLIEEGLKGKEGKYCLVIIKAFNDHTGNIIDAMRYVDNIHADITNISAGGYDLWPEEAASVSRYIAHGGVVVAAAGNENTNIDKQPYYPALYPKVISVGNLNVDGSKDISSNYGSSITRWEIGVHREVYGIRETGTSQAAALATGKIAAERL